MIIIFTGNGKGKTTAALGIALRALGRKKKVEIVQFMKNKDWFGYGEIKALKKFEDLCSVHVFGKKGWTYKDKITIEDKRIAKEAFDACLECVEKKPFLLVADELSVAVVFGLIREEEVLDLMRKCREKGVYLVITGRGATERMIKEADLVTEMREIKHPYMKGRRAVMGIDY